MGAGQRPARRTADRERLRYESPVTFRHKVIAAELQTGLWSAAKARVQGRVFSAWCGGSRHWHPEGATVAIAPGSVRMIDRGTV
jgi:hypothetical protein